MIIMAVKFFLEHGWWDDLKFGLFLVALAGFMFDMCRPNSFIMRFLDVLSRGASAESPAQTATKTEWTAAVVSMTVKRFCPLVRIKD